MRGAGAGVGVRGNGVGVKAGVKAVTGRGDVGTGLGFRATVGQLDVKELGGRFGEKERWRDCTEAGRRGAQPEGSPGNLKKKKQKCVDSSNANLVQTKLAIKCMPVKKCTTTMVRCCGWLPKIAICTARF